MSSDPLATYLHRTIGRRIAARRGEIVPRMTQEDLAAATGGVLSRSAVANIENGRQRIAVHHLYLLAEALKVLPFELLPDPSEVPSSQIIADRRISKDESARAFTELVLGTSAISEKDSPNEK